MKLLQLYQKEAPTQESPVKFAKYLRTPILNNVTSKNGRYYVDNSFQNSVEGEVSFLGLKLY